MATPAILRRAKPAALPEVVVRGRLPKTRRLGTTTHNPLRWGNVISQQPGGVAA